VDGAIGCPESSVNNYGPSGISGFRREAYENYVPPGYFAASSGNFVPTFRDNLAGPSSGVKNVDP
jgi:hypothetical protein